MKDSTQEDLDLLVSHFRVLNGWTVRLNNRKKNHNVSWVGTSHRKRYYIGTWDKSLGTEPQDYLIHEVLHAAVRAVNLIDWRKADELRMAEELLVQDICALLHYPVSPRV